MTYNPASLKNLRQYSTRAVKLATDQSIPNRSKIVASSESVESVSYPENQQVGRALAANILEGVAPQAAEVLARVVRGEIRTPPHVRIAAATRVLESQGLVGQQFKQSNQQSQSDRTAALAALAAALGPVMARRQAAVQAVDVVGLDTATSEKGDHQA